MPCHAAMTSEFLSLSPENDIESAAALMKQAKIDFAPVIDENGAAVGILSVRTLLENLLPVSVTVQEGIQLDIHVGAAPGIAKRLKKILPLKVSDLMERKIAGVYAETPLWEGVSLLVQNGGRPLLVLEQKSNKVIGLLTPQSAFDELSRLKDSEA